MDSSKLDSNKSNVNDLEHIKKNSIAYSYMVMPRYGLNLHELFALRKGRFSTESICSLGVQLLNILEQIHRAGHVFNDLKLDNLLLDFNSDVSILQTTAENIFENHNVTLIDFGFATTYLNEQTGEHIEKGQLDAFRGNTAFASLNQMKFFSTSRRDDLISLFYFLTYLLKEGNLPGVDLNDQSADVNDQFKRIFEAKKNQSSKDLCFGNSKDLYKYKKEVFSYRFVDTPNYESLRNIILKMLYKEQ